MTDGNNQACFVSTLAKLRVSSKEAVASADISSPESMYMHIDRPVQDKFVSILKETFESPHAVLVLLCGSVGDGKSHLLSYCNYKYPEMMGNYTIHNDSTASLYVDKPASYTLNMLMEGFSDENISSYTGKLILAINHGILGAFLEADSTNRFSKLKKYVQQAGLLDSGSEQDVVSEYFYSVNFADYHLYELTPNGVKSDYMLGLLKKITLNSPENQFFTDYSNCCMNCDSCNICPIKANYELLADSQIQDGIVKTLVECFIKSKLVISTRSLLNFIYEILVNEKYFSNGITNPRKVPGSIGSQAYLESLLPNMVFRKNDNSEIFESLTLVDPMRIRNEKVDDLIVFYENTNSVFPLFEKDLAEYTSLLKRIEKTNFADPSAHMLKELSLYLFVRTCWLAGRKKDLYSRDEDYTNYISALYAWNTGNGKALKRVYEIVEHGVLAWNGIVESGKEMQLSVANQKSVFHLIQSISLKQTTENLPANKSGDLSSFRDVLKLRYKVNSDTIVDLDVDYSLYHLLHKVEKGYIPSSAEKRVNVKCVDFVNMIASGGDKMEELIIRNNSQKEKVEFKLSYDESFGYTFEVN